jgi:hypothetical protein
MQSIASATRYPNLQILTEPRWFSGDRNQSRRQTALAPAFQAADASNRRDIDAGTGNHACSGVGRRLRVSLDNILNSHTVWLRSPQVNCILKFEESVWRAQFPIARALRFAAVL